MAVKHLTYRDIPSRTRAKAAAKAAARVKSSINSALTDEQRTEHLARLETLRKWASGDIPVEQEAQKSTWINHKVDVSEKLAMKEN